MMNKLSINAPKQGKGIVRNAQGVMDNGVNPQFWGKAWDILKAAGKGALSAI